MKPKYFLGLKILNNPSKIAILFNYLGYTLFGIIGVILSLIMFGVFQEPVNQEYFKWYGLSILFGILFNYLCRVLINKFAKGNFWFNEKYDTNMAIVFSLISFLILFFEW